MSRFLFSKINALAISICLMGVPFGAAYAAAGCCSHHGGVNGCNNSTNHQLCKDGTSSPTCLCDGGKMKSTTVKSKNVVMPITTNGNSTVTTNTTTETTTVNTKVKGCCSRHGGVAKCDKVRGYQMCKDGTTSSACKCS